VHAVAYTVGRVQLSVDSRVCGCLAQIADPYLAMLYRGSVDYELLGFGIVVGCCFDSLGVAAVAYFGEGKAAEYFEVGALFDELGVSLCSERS